MEQFTTKCNVISNGVTILDNRNVSITIRPQNTNEAVGGDAISYGE